MKPKTKLQVYLASLPIPELTERQRAWAMERIIDPYYMIMRNRHYCLECNHKWYKRFPKVRPEKMPKVTCPSCRKKLRFTFYSRYLDVYDYFGIMSYIEDYQIFRLFYICKYFHKKEKPRFFISEVVRHFFGVTGKLKTESFTKINSTFNYHRWQFHVDLEPRPKTGASRHRESLAPCSYYPGRAIHPILRRNGFTGACFDIPPKELIHALLVNSKAETLLKAKQHSLFRMCCSHPDKIDKIWRTIKICIRNNYIVQDANDYYDYIATLKMINKDILNAHYVCPEDFHSAHQKTVKKLVMKREKDEYERIKREIIMYQPTYHRKKSKYFDLEFKHRNITVRPIKDVAGFYSLSKMHNHCIFVREYFKKEESLIFCAYVNNHPTEAVEVDILRGRILQARGANNLPTQYNDKIIRLVNKNLDTIVQHGFSN